VEGSREQGRGGEAKGKGNGRGLRDGEGGGKWRKWTEDGKPTRGAGFISHMAETPNSFSLPGGGELCPPGSLSFASTPRLKGI
jgi:hypothetical protein